MKVCFVMPNMSGGGAQRVVSVLANELSKRGHKVSLLITNTDVIEYSLNEEIEIDVGCAHAAHGPLAQIKYIRCKMKNAENTTFISFLDNQNVFTVLAGLGLSNKVIVSQRNDPHRAFPDRKYMRIISWWIYALADAAVFQTLDAKACYPRFAEKKYHIILNPLSSNLPERYNKGRTKRVVTVCRLNQQKNLYLAIDAFCAFSKAFPEYSFEIYGKGELEQSLKGYAKKEGMSNKVIFKGFYKDVFTQIEDAAMFLISSDFEGLSNSMIEAMAMGIPTIATDCPIGGARMVIQNGINGFLVPVRNQEAMTAAMEKLANDRKLMETVSENAAKLREQLSVDKICSQWEQLLHG